MADNAVGMYRYLEANCPQRMAAILVLAVQLLEVPVTSGRVEFPGRATALPILIGPDPDAGLQVNPT